MGMPKLARILRYPVKALSAEALEHVTLSAGHGLPGDRRFALALADTPWDEPHWLPAERLLTLARFPRLAQLDTRVDGHRLTIRRRGRVVLSADLRAAHGLQVISAFFAAFLAGQCFGHPHLVEYADGFGDGPKPRVSLVGSGTLDEVARLSGHGLDPAELRINLLIGNLPPRAEHDWVGRRVRMGAVVLAVTGPVERAILPELLGATFGYSHIGMWAEVATGGELCIGTAVSVEEGATPAPDKRAGNSGAATTAK
jgi:uncharacterized protein YcbX